METLEKITFEEQSTTSSRESSTIVSVPTINLDQYGNSTVRYSPEEFISFEFNGNYFKKD